MSAILLLLLACWCASASAESRRFYPLEDAHIHFNEFILKYNIQYSEYEKKHRFEIFKQNLAEINRVNEQDLDVVLGINRFSDLTNKEFTKMYTGLRTDGDFVHSVILTDVDIPPEPPGVSATEHLDWRMSNVVSRVKQQGICGSCWAFSVAGLLESQYAIKTKELLDLSPQQLVDCDELSFGCCGGFPTSAIGSIIEKGGIMEEEEYMYMGYQGLCRVQPLNTAVKVKNVNIWKIHSQEKIRQLLSTYGPISILVRSSGLQQYHGGFALCALGELDHAVLLVGYGVDAPTGKPYWLVKNSWGHRWGEEGYFRMARGEGEDSCGMQIDIMTTAEIELNNTKHFDYTQHL